MTCLRYLVFRPLSSVKECHARTNMLSSITIAVVIIILIVIIVIIITITGKDYIYTNSQDVPFLSLAILR